MLPSSGKQPVKAVRISDERLIFTQPHRDASNFGIDEHGNTVLVLLDFGQIVLLPEFFATFFFFFFLNPNLYPAAHTTRQRGGHVSYVTYCDQACGVGMMYRARPVGTALGCRGLVFMGVAVS